MTKLTILWSKWKKDCGLTEERHFFFLYVSLLSQSEITETGSDPHVLFRVVLLRDAGVY